MWVQEDGGHIDQRTTYLRINRQQNKRKTTEGRQHRIGKSVG